MKKLMLLSLAAGATMIAGLASAQEAAPPAPPAPGAMAEPGMQPPPPPEGGPRMARGDDRPERGFDRPGRDGPHGRPGRDGPRGEGRDFGPGRDGGPKGAHIRLQDGTLSLDVKCAEDAPMQACSDMASRLLEQAKAAPRG